MPATTSKKRKIALLGFRSVGKSSLAIQFVQGQFVDHYEPTIENVFSKKVNMHGHEYELDLVDTAGQDECSIFPPEYTVQIHGYVLVYSIDNAYSFSVCRTLHEKMLDLLGQTSVPIVLVGNKSDLQTDRQVSVAEGQQLAQEMSAVFLETSAKKNLNVKEVFLKVLAQMERSGTDQTAPDGSKSCLIS